MPLGELSEGVGLDYVEPNWGGAATCRNCFHTVEFHDIEEGDADGGRCQWPDCECKWFR